MGTESQAFQTSGTTPVNGGIIRPERRKAGARGGDCPICLVPHEEQIHAATLSVRQWLRQEVLRRIDGVDPDERPALT